MARRNDKMVLAYEQDLRLFRTRFAQFGLLLLVVGYLALPMQITDFWLNVLNFVGMFAIGALGLNLLTGYAGQVSLGHAFFLAAGAYTAASIGGETGLPLLVWIPLTAVVGGAIGALVGPFALRLHGNYLAIVTLGLLFLGEHVLNNWESVTGGNAGTPVIAGLSIGPLDFTDLKLFGQSFTDDQSLFWLIWAVVALAALIVKNIARSRPGRALQAVRDRDLAAEVVGVSLTRYKIGAFVVSSALAAVAGGFYGVALQQYVQPEEFGGVAGLVLSINFIAMIIIGGLGTVFGSILGALFVAATPRLVQEYSDVIPLVDSGVITVASFNNIIFALLIIVFLVFEPRGVAAVWLRLKAYFKSWPFSY